MMSICGANCDECEMKNKCKGCKETNGCPFCKKSWIANYKEIGGKEKYKEFKKEIINELNYLMVKKINY